MYPVVYFSWAILCLAAAYLILRRVRHDYRQYAELRPFTAFLQFAMFCLQGMLVGLSYGLDMAWPPLNPYPVGIAIGAVLAGVGLWLLAAALGIFGPIQRMLGLKKDELKQAGVYRWTRNPQILGYGLILLAIPFVWFSWYVVISVVLYVPIAHMMVRVEEEHLENLFGDEYRAYCARTPRYLGKPQR